MEARVVTRSLSDSSGEREGQPAQVQDKGQWQQEQQPSLAHFPALRHPAFADGIQRVNSPGSARAFDAAAYAAAAAARTASPGKNDMLVMRLHLLQFANFLLM